MRSLWAESSIQILTSNFHPKHSLRVTSRLIFGEHPYWILARGSVLRSTSLRTAFMTTAAAAAVFLRSEIEVEEVLALEELSEAEVADELVEEPDWLVS
jgi:hypothetical protein